jgi:hypothetical protein
LTKKKFKPVIILFYDTTAASAAMLRVFNVVSALSELKGSAFFTLDYGKLNVGHFMCRNVLNSTHNGTFTGSCN